MEVRQGSAEILRSSRHVRDIRFLLDASPLEPSTCCVVLNDGLTTNFEGVVIGVHQGLEQYQSALASFFSDHHQIRTDVGG